MTQHGTFGNGTRYLRSRRQAMRAGSTLSCFFAVREVTRWLAMAGRGAALAGRLREARQWWARRGEEVKLPPLTDQEAQSSAWRDLPRAHPLLGPVMRQLTAYRKRLSELRYSLRPAGSPRRPRRVPSGSIAAAAPAGGGRRRRAKKQRWKPASEACATYAAEEKGRAHVLKKRLTATRRTWIGQTEGKRFARKFCACGSRAQPPWGCSAQCSASLVLRTARELLPSSPGCAMCASRGEGCYY